MQTAVTSKLFTKRYRCHGDDMRGERVHINVYGE